MKCISSRIGSLQIFNGCPLKINCTASWIHPETHDQHILVGAEEGIYTLNLTELHENAMDLLYPRRTVWMFVIKDVLMTLSGKTPSLYRHDLLGLHSNQSDRLTISRYAMHKIPSKFVPKKFAMTSKVNVYFHPFSFRLYFNAKSLKEINLA